MKDIIKTYNYDEFIEEKFERWMRFDESPLLNEVAPDFPLNSLNGKTIQLSAIWKKSKYTVIEFGSFT